MQIVVTQKGFSKRSDFDIFDQQHEELFKSSSVDDDVVRWDFHVGPTSGSCNVWWNGRLPAEDVAR